MITENVKSQIYHSQLQNLRISKNHLNITIVLFLFLIILGFVFNLPSFFFFLLIVLGIFDLRKKYIQFLFDRAILNL